ncbi:MAG: RNA pseudouridine synthase [Planctomycetota bacterium]|jgi:23S rRNA pseudouridine1911/1915/1917 synthase|nr:RNA pseudouridine synthase [Planctomycetota bacterium]
MARSENGFGVVYRDNHLLALDKPAGLPSQPDASGDAALVDLARESLRREFAKPGGVYLALAHRLDRPTSGIVLAARTGKAARRLAEAFRKREVRKTYLALVEAPAAFRPEGELRDWLAGDGRGGMRPAGSGTPGAREAVLAYRRLAAASGRALLEVDLLTGVKHQIRRQLANLGLPVVGDFRYGSGGGKPPPVPVAGGRAILLHAWRIGLVHPVRREALELSAPPPPFWRDYLAAFPALISTLRA